MRRAPSLAVCACLLGAELGLGKEIKVDKDKGWVLWNNWHRGKTRVFKVPFPHCKGVPGLHSLPRKRTRPSFDFSLFPPYHGNYITWSLIERLEIHYDLKICFSFCRPNLFTCTWKKVFTYKCSRYSTGKAQILYFLNQSISTVTLLMVHVPP